MSEGKSDKEIIFVTSNSHKFMEVEKMFHQEGLGIRWAHQEYEEVQADTTEEISLRSAINVSKEIKGKFFLDDTGLYIDSLSGFPGPYSSYVFRTIGNNGILRLLENLDRRATFTTVITYFDGNEFRQFRGDVKGKIAKNISPGNGFGYDPIFLPGESDQTLAQIDTDQKNKVSHRGLAVKKLITYLKEIR
ncbi:MAG: XTP/dITP diphosphatase [Candidatus Thermoplasmatota archaeon]|jgi:XTP/dITP diphosphohydrolase|nr:XTP/dITP diphosphatase [Candidatus Thermoplasmatota archaeon]